MKLTQLTMIAAVSFGLPLCAYAQAKVNPETEKELMKIEQDLSAALTKLDAAALEPLIADDVYMVAPDGMTQTKTEFVADIKTGALKLESNKLDDMKVNAAGADMAVVTYRSTDKGTYKGKEISGKYRWMDVFAKRNGRWLLVASQGTSMDAQKH
jgi:ketosteroid isomerase-like protein